ncbi:hypothetical protein D1BOALGB6SA_9170 [Olavius sp. associated proteobacterium Delta 1]|nr:hypothetical protein D1BOALGB6SA_9170 [Olavius sp. associated proteobacterium Delta 1]
MNDQTELSNRLIKKIIRPLSTNFSDIRIPNSDLNFLSSAFCHLLSVI